MPALIEPALTQMNLAEMLVYNTFCGMITSPSTSQKSISAGLISIKIVQFPGMVTFSVAAGNLFSGHCEVFDQSLINFSLMN